MNRLALALALSLAPAVVELNEITATIMPEARACGPLGMASIRWIGIVRRPDESVVWDANGGATVPFSIATEFSCEFLETLRRPLPEGE